MADGKALHIQGLLADAHAAGSECWLSSFGGFAAPDNPDSCLLAIDREGGCGELPCKMGFIWPGP